MFTRIGKYKIEREIGRGGFGQVYRAFDPSVGRAVAIKVLNPGADASLLARFRNEAVTAGNLQHRHIVTVYEFGEHDGLAYLVMEFLQGEDLQHVIQAGGPGSLLRKVQIMSQVASGLHAFYRGWYRSFLNNRLPSLAIQAMTALSLACMSRPTWIL